MLITKTNPSGIDFYIQQLQTKLHTELVKAWKLTDNTVYACYGRCYRNRDNANGYVAEVYTGGNEYKEVYWDDNLTAISFFGLGSQLKVGLSGEADVHLVFFTDLSKLALKDYKGNVITHRADEEVRKSVTDIIGRFSFGFTVVSVDLWIENVLKEYPGSRRDKSSLVIKASMHPVHCFRINLKLLYNTSKIC